MKEPNDNLDQLLAQAPPPQAPPWFEQRLMARLRRERETEARPVFGRIWRWTSAIAVCAFVMAGSFAWKSMHTTTPSVVPVAQEEIYQGLDAFAAYQEQSQSWNIEW